MSKGKMSDSEDHNKEIPIAELKPGMYVVSISSENRSLSVKSEGYVLNVASINQLIQSGISHVVDFVFFTTPD